MIDLHLHTTASDGCCTPVELIARASAAGIQTLLTEAGLAAIEAYHSDHDDTTQRRYVELARDFNLAVTGGSDYHGNGRPRDSLFGVVDLPAEEFARLMEKVNEVRAIACIRLPRPVAWSLGTVQDQ